MSISATPTNKPQLPIAMSLLSRAILATTLTSMTILTGTILASNAVLADDNTSVVDQINITVPVSCTISGTGQNSHNANINNGLYEDDIGTTTLHAFCNDNEGFAIYAAGFTGDEVGGTNSNKLVGTSTSGNETIATGLATTAGNPDISNWAMKLAITQDSGDTTGTNAFVIDSAQNLVNGTLSGTATSFSQYHTVPNEYTKVAHKNSGTDMTTSTGGVKLTTTYAAYISKTQPADTYSGQVIYTLVHPASHAVPVFLNPNADNISEVNYMQQFAIVSDANRRAIIDSMVPEQQYIVRDSRDGKSYTIAKYAVADYGENSVSARNYLASCFDGGNYNASNCDTTIYNELPSEWQVFVDTCEPVRAESVSYTCDESLAPVVYDVWMTKNLDLDIDSARTYTNEDTDLGYNTTTNEYTTASWKPARSTYVATTTQTHEWCQGGTRNSEYGYCENNDTPESYDTGELYWNLTESYYSDWDEYYDSCDYSTSTPVCDQSKNPINTYVSSTGTTQYHLGNYYNWAAALATNDSSTFNNSDLVEQSICPAGWTLPRIGDGEDTFYSLWNQYGFSSNSYNDTNSNNAHDANEDALWTSSLYFAASSFFDGSLGGVGSDGYFWAPVPGGSNGAGGAYFYVDGSVYPSNGSRRGDGCSVRCILRSVVNSGSDGGGGGGK